MKNSLAFGTSAIFHSSAPSGSVSCLPPQPFQRGEVSLPVRFPAQDYLRRGVERSSSFERSCGGAA